MNASEGNPLTADGGFQHLAGSVISQSAKNPRAQNDQRGGNRADASQPHEERRQRIQGQ
jgi:hypothetical protein